MATFSRKAVSWFIALLLVRLGSCTPSRAAHATILRRDELLDEYDFIVAGAGTAGLTVGDRLSENGKHTVLVVEYGYLDTSDSVNYVMDPRVAELPDSLNPDIYPAATRWYNLSSVPQIGLENRTENVPMGAAVGGSSAVNGMWFDRGTAEDYDSWVWAAGDHQEEYGKVWGWKNMLPFFKKSCTFHSPTQEQREKYEITADEEAAYGGSGPIHVSYPPFEWPGLYVIKDALQAVPGLELRTEGADGNATGIFWIPSSIEPKNRTRSYAATGHYLNPGGAATRKNFHLLTAHRVTRVILGSPENKTNAVAPLLRAEGVVVTPRDGPMPQNPPRVRARREVVISAGTIHTPQILQRSGIGPRRMLEAAKVDVKVDLPGVGANLQDHPFFAMSYNYLIPFLRTANDLSGNVTFREEALVLWKANKTGPFAGYPNIGSFWPLTVMSNRSQYFVDKLLAQDPAVYLPPGTDPTVLAGARSHQKVRAKQLLSKGSALLELPFSGGSTFSLLLLKMVSRGTVALTADDDGVGRGDVEPAVDYRAFSNPLDMEFCIEMIKLVRWFMAGDKMQKAAGPIELSPGPDVRSDAEIEEWVRKSIAASDGHLVGTAALGPRELGGVVGPGLEVHGTVGLSVADNSIITLVPGTHTSSTAYAIGEQAAHLILQRHGHS